MIALTTNQVLTGVSLTLVLAVGCQIAGKRLRIPALILLLPAGFIAGACTDDINPNRLLGASFQPLVSLSVAVILYDAGTGLNLSKLTGHTRRVVIRLLLLGVPLTGVIAALVAEPLFGMSHGSAVMFGAILVVSGPTVVGPLLRFVRPTERLRRILTWEGSLVDPVGGLLGAVVFHAVTASTHEGLGNKLAQFALSVVVGLIGGGAGIVVLWLVLTKLRLGEGLGTSAQLAAVIAAAGVCDMIRDDTGLIAAIVMGLALANLRIFDMPARRPFFEILVQLIIGVLFISISATVTPSSVRHLILPSLALAAVLVLLVRPVVAGLSSLGTDLPNRERAFLGWMAPRGIVAAATASTFSSALVVQHIGGANKILPGTFLIIVLTVTLYGLTANPVARRLHVTRPSVARPLVVGGEPWVLDLACALHASGLSVLVWAESEPHRTEIAAAGLELAPDGLIADATGKGAEIEGVTTILLLTAENGFNALAAALLQGGDGGRVYRVGSPADANGRTSSYAGGDVLFATGLTGDAMARKYHDGARISPQSADAGSPHDDLLFRVRVGGRLIPVTSNRVPGHEPGDISIVLRAADPNIRSVSRA